MKTYRLILVLSVMLLWQQTTGGAKTIKDSLQYRAGFLYRNGQELMLDGKPYHCVSFNSFQLCGCGNKDELFTDEQVESLFASLPKNTMIRTWSTPAFNHCTEYLVRLAEKYNIKLILSLGDGRSGCGDTDGAPNGDGSGKTQEWYEQGFRRKNLPHVIEMTSRYKNSPAIAMWEIINEPGEADWKTIRDFLHEIAAVIKKHDPYHLVESGTFAGWAYEGYEHYRDMHDSPNIDVGNLHEYDYDYQQSNIIESPHFDPCLKAMSDLNKPLIIGETGIESGDSCRTSRTQRVMAMRKKFDLYIRKGAGAVLVWNLANTAPDCGLTFSTDDPLLNMIINYQRNIVNKNKGKEK